MKIADEKKRFEFIYKAYFQTVSDFCVSYVKNIEEARDIAQDVFYAFWMARGRSYSKKEILAFLYTTARNKCINQLRFQKMVKDKEKEYRELISDAFFLDEITRNETYRIVREAINQLPDRTRQVAYLTLQGYSLQEIAAHLEISLNTVKTLKKNAYIKLRELINNQEIMNLLIFFFV